MLKRLIQFATSEIVLWSAGLFVLYFLGSSGTEGTVCLFAGLGLERCWGCGLGHAVHDAMHLQFTHSVAHHPFGIPVLIILLYRIFQLATPYFKTRPPWTSNS